MKRAAPRQEPLPFLDEHPMIRPLDDYARIVAAAFIAAEIAPGRRFYEA